MSRLSMFVSYLNPLFIVLKNQSIFLPHCFWKASEFFLFINLRLLVSRLLNAVQSKVCRSDNFAVSVNLKETTLLTQCICSPFEQINKQLKYFPSIKSLAKKHYDMLFWRTLKKKQKSLKFVKNTSGWHIVFDTNQLSQHFTISFKKMFKHFEHFRAPFVLR